MPVYFRRELTQELSSWMKHDDLESVCPICCDVSHKANDNKTSTSFQQMACIATDLRSSWHLDPSTVMRFVIMSSPPSDMPIFSNPLLQCEAFAICCSFSCKWLATAELQTTSNHLRKSTLTIRLLLSGVKEIKYWAFVGHRSELTSLSEAARRVDRSDIF
jgi:hypothetical protein